MASILIIPALFIISTCWLYLFATWAPNLQDGNHGNKNRLYFPSNLEELKDIASTLSDYSQSHPIYVFVLFVSAYLYKQTFAIPGSALLNLLSGALFGLVFGFFLSCFLTACGASLCYLLSSYAGRDLVMKYFPEKLQSFREKVDENREDLLYFLLFIRLFPMTPNWLINIVSPFVNIPLHLFFASVFVGLMPYNFICVQTGVLLVDLQSMDNIITFSTILKLATIAFVTLLPTGFRRFRNYNRSASPAAGAIKTE